MQGCVAMLRPHATPRSTHRSPTTAIARATAAHSPALLRPALRRTRFAPTPARHERSTRAAADVAYANVKTVGTYTGTVVVTREQGKNDKLATKLRALGLECVELPLIEHAAAADTERLPEVLAARAWDWVVITSPEGAHVLLDGWEKASRPTLRIAAVGDATSAALRGHLDVAFVPSKAMGKVLAAELPLDAPGAHVLYAGSALADDAMSDALRARGFTVTRLATYTTRQVEAVDTAALARAVTADVVTFASPSTVKAWVQLAGDNAHAPRVACIGYTSAVACATAHLSPCFYPEQPGMDGWVASVLDALKATGQQLSAKGYITFKF